MGEEPLLSENPEGQTEMPVDSLLFELGAAVRKANARAHVYQQLWHRLRGWTPRRSAVPAPRLVVGQEVAANPADVQAKRAEDPADRPGLRLVAPPAEGQQGVEPDPSEVRVPEVSPVAALLTVLERTEADPVELERGVTRQPEREAQVVARPRAEPEPLAAVAELPPRRSTLFDRISAYTVDSALVGEFLRHRRKPSLTVTR